METLSVIVPVYNSKDHLKSCVTSIAKVNAYCRTRIIREIILVDDGSTDGSQELCDRIAQEISDEKCRVLVVHQQNSGVSAARNVGLNAATGSFVFFVDSDDTIEPRVLAELFQAPELTESVDMVVFGLTFDFYSGMRIYRQDIMLPPVEGVMSFDEYSSKIYSLFEGNVISPIWNKLIRRKVIAEAGIGLREEMILYEDLEFSLRVMASCSKVYFFSKPVYHYRLTHDDSKTSGRLKRIAHIPDIVDKIDDALVPFRGCNEMLLSIYLMLAREKIKCTNKAETAIVCNDFKKWIDSKQMVDSLLNNEYASLLYHNRRMILLHRRRISRIRGEIKYNVKLLSLRIKKRMGRIVGAER